MAMQSAGPPAQLFLQTMHDLHWLTWLDCVLWLQWCQAFEGLQVRWPGVSRGAIDGAAIAILVVLFLAQRFGTAKVGLTFSPIIFVWLVANALIGAASFLCCQVLYRMDLPWSALAWPARYTPLDMHACSLRGGCTPSLSADSASN